MKAIGLFILLLCCLTTEKHAPMSSLSVPARLRLRGGGHHEFTISSDEQHFASAVRYANQRSGNAAGDEEQVIRIAPDAVEENLMWSADQVVSLKAQFKIIGAEECPLSGPLCLEEGSRGSWHALQWKTVISTFICQEAGVKILGGPWKLSNCILHSNEFVVLRCDESSLVEISNCLIGGFGKQCDDSNLRIDMATDGVVAMGSSDVTLKDCTIQDCGLFSSAGLRIGGRAKAYVSNCFLFENEFVAVCMHDACTLTVKDSALLRNPAVFASAMAQESHFIASNISYDGTLWLDKSRPGRFEVNGEEKYLDLKNFLDEIKDFPHLEVKVSNSCFWWLVC
mmetsp:Transcript_2355/g.7149  ORF Transcript_2355/g.7149 Transcript_2355/m.7149 type:complete len:339 (-) Transcript_2355:1711-2727(-)